jgi:dihydroorotase
MARFGRLTDAPASFRLVGARLVDPAAGTDTVADLAVVDGVLVAPGDAPRDLPTHDAAGLVVAPGLCDLHAHLREPGDEAAETLESAARAAAHGGFTTVCAMPNTQPALDEPGRLAAVLGRCSTLAATVRVIGAVTRSREGAQLVDMGAMAAAGAVGFSDDGSSLSSARLARAALAYLAPLNLPLIVHCEEASLAAGTVMRAGPVATRLGLSGWPASAELTMVERDIALAAKTGGWVHFTHLSTAASLDAVRAAKSRGLRVTCDVTPHHLALTDAWVAGDRRFSWEEPDPRGPFVGELDASAAYDGRCRVNPPLPSRADALALLAGVADGTVDAIATDHAPHPPERTLVEFEAAAPGMVGLETALSLGLAAVAASALSLATLLAALSVVPARLIGESRGLAPAQSADLVVFDPAASWTISESALSSRSCNTPLLGRTVPGVVHLTVAAGRVTYDDLGGAENRLGQDPGSA